VDNSYWPYAYKIKKELKFGKALDFSKLQLRRTACQKEVTLNKILCNDMYKGVVKVVRSGYNNHTNKDVKLQKCYKACVRAKVCFFKAVNEKNSKQKVTCLARSYLEFL
jgi:aminoglycoside phosphotransferase family enzyme